MARRICLPDLPTRLDALNQRCAVPTLLRHPFAHNGYRWHWNLHQLSITYACWPRLRSRLTLSGRAFLRKPQAFGGQDSHLPYRYSCRHSHFPALHCSLRYSFRARGTLPYHSGGQKSEVSKSEISPETATAVSHFTATYQATCSAFYLKPDMLQNIVYELKFLYN